MPVTEESRHRLHQALDRTLGEEDATTSMEHLPPGGWIDIATKQDIERLEQRFAATDARMAAGFAAVDVAVAQVGRDVAALSTRIDDGHRRSEALTTRVDQLIWQVIAVLGTVGVLMIGYAQIVG